jgi:2-C-methyl-D-erythritol 2,4-cyclodiphosphate synthase
VANNFNPAHLRVGIGHDTHRLKPGGPLRLGGIEIPFEMSLDGHSDADVLLHAIIDALLGAAALGDIGELFPDTDSRNAGRDSAELLQIAWEEVRKHDYEIVNLDSIIFAQRPKLSIYKDSISRRIAELLRIERNQIGIKAKTGEGVGMIGELRVMQAQSVVLLYRSTG